MIKQFKEFAFKGNLVDMAVGFILGTGFATVVKSLVNNVIMPPLGLILGDVDFSKLAITLKEATPAVKEGDKVITPAVEAVQIKYGLFLGEALAFIMLAFAVFIIVKKVIEGMKKKEEEEVKKPAEPPRQEVLLEEIRDALKK